MRCRIGENGYETRSPGGFDRDRDAHCHPVGREARRRGPRTAVRRQHSRVRQCQWRSSNCRCSDALWTEGETSRLERRWTSGAARAARAGGTGGSPGTVRPARGGRRGSSRDWSCELGQSVHASLQGTNRRRSGGGLRARMPGQFTGPASARCSAIPRRLEASVYSEGPLVPIRPVSLVRAREVERCADLMERPVSSSQRGCLAPCRTASKADL